MLPRQFDCLKERLLKAGVAYRHAHRFVRELRDHYDDALRDELAKGSSRETAEQTAWTRIGNEEALANSVLARPELRSVASRYPGLILGIAPVLLWIGVVALGAASFASTIELAELGQPTQLAVGYAICFFSMRILPVSLGIAVLTICARQRLRSLRAVAGMALVAALSGTLTISLTMPATGTLGELGISSSLLPFMSPHVSWLGRPDGAALVVGLLRGVCMLALSAVPYLLWHLQRRTLRAGT